MSDHQQGAALEDDPSRHDSSHPRGGDQPISLPESGVPYSDAPGSDDSSFGRASCGESNSSSSSGSGSLVDGGLESLPHVGLDGALTDISLSSGLA